jgi:aryl-alcohol dehydrogenase-like predicted oxidoreductase
MQTRTLGRTGPRVSALGLGAMGMSALYGPTDRAESLATVHAALDAGVNLIDTGDFYGAGHNELLLREALASRPREDAVLSVKFGAQVGPDGDFLGVDGSPAAVKASLAYTLQRLGTDHVDVYRPARLDPAVPIEETVGAVADLIAAGYVRHLGLSEVSAETLRRAHAVHPVVDVQIEWSLLSRTVERSVLPAARELGVGITAYGVLSRGLLGGHWQADRTLAAQDFRAHSPRFSGENLPRNLALVEALRAVAAARGATVAQLAVAWALHRGPDVVPLVGARRRDRLTESLGALDVELTASELAQLEEAVPDGAAAGERYAPAQMAALDSER